MGPEDNGLTKSHDVEIVMGEIGTADQVKELEEFLSLAYRRLSDRAMKEQMVIVSTVLTSAAHVMPDGAPGLSFTIIAHRVSQLNIAQMQAEQRFGIRKA